MTLARLLLLIFAAQSFLVPSSCTQDYKKDEILKHTLPAYAIISNAELLNLTRCEKELEEFRVAVEHRLLWSLKALDSSGEPRDGFLYGNNYWLGSRSQCEDISNRKMFVMSMKEIANNSRYRNIEDEFPPFEFSYFVAYFKHNSTLQYHNRLPNEDLISLGICLPASCTSNQLATIFEDIFKSRTLLFGDLYSADFKLVEVKDLRDDHLWLINGTVFVVGFIVLVTFLLMVAGTIYDVLVRRKNKKHKKFHSCENNNMAIQLSTKEPHEDLENQQAILKTPSVLARSLQAFSVYTNTRILFSTKLNEESIPAVHGLRFLGMLWIIMVHTLYYMIDVTDNRALSWRKADSIAAQVISNATLSVDTFFFLSGFLMTHLYLSSKESKETHRQFCWSIKLKNFLLSFTKRFIRLTPAYMMALALFQINSKWYSKTSLFYMSERGDVVCPKYWWRNILYIQNFFGRETMCMSWSWYLANDMQFFIIGTFLLMLIPMYFNVVVGLLSVMLIGSTVITGYLSYIYEYVPTMDQQYHFLDQLYDPPWTRIGPYIVGIVTGYINAKLDKKLRLKRRTVIICWILGSACNLFVLFGLAERQISVVASAFYSALSRTAWGIGIAWIVIACCTNHGGVVNKILSFKGWVPLSRLTYSVYLLNPLLIGSIYLHGETATHIDVLRNGTTFLGNSLVTYVCAYIFTLMFETPYVLLMRQYISSLNRKK